MSQDASPTRDSPSEPTRAAAIIVAAGNGVRTRSSGAIPPRFRPPGGEALPKQYWLVGDVPVLTRTLAAFLDHPRIISVVVVIRPEDRAAYDMAVSRLDMPLNSGWLMEPVAGGASRQESVHAGLEALVDVAPDLVLIHDAVRPFVSPATIRSVIDSLSTDVAVLPGTKVPDTIKRTDEAGRVIATIPREKSSVLWRATTPQGFRYPEILAAHRALSDAGINDATDDAAVAERAGYQVRLIAEEEGNMKLTTLADFERAERRVRDAAFLSCPDIRVGSGYDVHVLEPGDGVWLCGVYVPHDQRLMGHSDADVALHALTDAILGALGNGDIGRHFPPTDERWRGVPSTTFLADAMRRLKERRGLLAHCDVTIVAEAPKIGPHREKMRARIAETCGVSLDRVGVKATTSEGLGFAGRREGIAAFATATVRLPL